MILFFFTLCDTKHQGYCRVLKDRYIEDVVCINMKSNVKDIYIFMPDSCFKLVAGQKVSSQS